jgi:hypothetical protein
MISLQERSSTTKQRYAVERMRTTATQPQSKLIEDLLERRNESEAESWN